MRYELSSDHRVYSFCRRHEPVLTVDPGDEILLHTRDCMDNQMPLESDPQGLKSILPGRANPATGAVAVRGAEPGMTLAAEILEIKSADRGLIYAADRRTNVLQVRIPVIEDGLVRFSEDYTLKLDPMIGVIGVAPVYGDILTTTPGQHGGNMDCSDIKAGATVYLPIAVPGALFGCGDVHALQGDGESGGMGIEVKAEVLVRLTLYPRVIVPWPIVEREGHFAVLTAAKTLDEAADLAYDVTRDLLIDQLGVDDPDSGMLQSLVCDLRVNQIVDPLKGARMCVPRTLLPQLRW